MVLAALQKAVDAIGFEIDRRENTVRYDVPGVVNNRGYGPLAFEMLFWVENWKPDVWHTDGVIASYIHRWRQYVFLMIAQKLPSDPSWHKYIYQYAEAVRPAQV